MPILSKRKSERGSRMHWMSSNGIIRCSAGLVCTFNSIQHLNIIILIGMSSGIMAGNISLFVIAIVGFIISKLAFSDRISFRRRM